MSYNPAFPRILFTGVLIQVMVLQISAQSVFPKPPRRSTNLMEISGAYLKTIYSFKPAYYDTLLQPGPDPLLIPQYQDTILIPQIISAVLSNQVKVFNPNFWGSVPQLLNKNKYEEFDTLDILNYLSAGWDTSMMIDNDGKIEPFPVYRTIPFEEISGIFFFESWWLDKKDYRIYKDVSAYLPIREYLVSIYEGYENTEIRKRLLFMVLPEWSTGSIKVLKYKPKDFRLLWKDLQYEVQLFNKPYDLYLYREGEYGQISQLEFNEWQYHTFDFYRYFDANLFLEKIISGILLGKLEASLPGQSDSPLKRMEFIKILQNLPEENLDDELGDAVTGNTSLPGPVTHLPPEDYALSDLNSIRFHEDWYINPENLQIYKDVRGITINRHESLIDNYTGDFIQGSIKPLFTVWFRN